MNTVNVNGKTYEVPNGCSVSVINGKIYFDGKLADDFKNWKDKKIEITIVGDCEEVKVDAGNVTVKGSVKGNVSVDAGDISVEGDIRGNVSADCGDISANYIAGNATTDCGNIGRNSIFSKIIQKYL